MVKNQGERWWNKVEQRHDRSGIGSLVRPEDIYISPWDLKTVCAAPPAATSTSSAPSMFSTPNATSSQRSSSPHVRRSAFTAPFPRSIEALNALMRQEARILLAAANQGEVERLAGLLQEYQVPYRLGSRSEQHGSTTVYSESSYLAGDLRTPVIVKTPIATGVQILDLGPNDPPARSSSSARRISPTKPMSRHARSDDRSPRQPPSSPTSAISPSATTSSTSSTASRATWACASSKRTISRRSS